MASEPFSAEPVRPQGTSEEIQLTRAAQDGPYVAWRGPQGELETHALGPEQPATIGRASDSTVTIAYPQMSRLHARVTLRLYRDPKATSVFLLDCDSKHGSEHRTVILAHGVPVARGDWQTAPREPARAVQLDAGEHDVRLAGRHFVLIGGVPLDEGVTREREDPLPEPTAREREVLVELCRPLFEAPGAYAPTPSNAEIGLRLPRPIGAERVSDIMSDLYVKYALFGTPQQRRGQLADLAHRRLIGRDDYSSR